MGLAKIPFAKRSLIDVGLEWTKKLPITTKVVSLDFPDKDEYFYVIIEDKEFNDGDVVMAFFTHNDMEIQSFHHWERETGMRKHLDSYYTPESAIRNLLEFVPRISFNNWILEPCCGTKNISKQFRNCTTCDIDSSVNPMFIGDMSKRESWIELETAYGHYDWVVTNPPFSHALEIAQLGLEHAQKGMALLLRLSFLEPTYKRQDWLSENPPNQLIVLPRISFTGDGKTDSVTCGWMIWDKEIESANNIFVVKK